MAARVIILCLCVLPTLTVAGAAVRPRATFTHSVKYTPAVAPPAYEWAAHVASVPPTILFAVAEQESGILLHGRRLPWPWTLNIDGSPRRFATQAAACEALRSALKSLPSHGIDVGLAQIDVGYYRDRVATPCELLDPYRNLLIAAEILRRDHTAGATWMVAVGRYHRPAGGAPAAHYRHAVAALLARVLAHASVREQLATHLP